MCAGVAGRLVSVSGRNAGCSDSASSASRRSGNHELQRHGPVDTFKGCSAERCASRRQTHQKVQRDLVVVPAVVVEEVLDDPQQPLDSNVDIQLLAHLAPERLLGRLAMLGTAARQDPERLAFGAVQQHAPVVDSDADDAVVEAAVAVIEADHE